MLFVRPGRLADLDALEHMARTAQPVLHSLPHDRRALEARVALSEDSFRADVDFPGEEFYLFVLEDAQSGKLMGTASIVAAAGYSDPFYAFRNDALIHASRELHVNRKIHALTMSHELTGKSRLAGLLHRPVAARRCRRASDVARADDVHRRQSQALYARGVLAAARRHRRYRRVAVLGSGGAQVLRPQFRGHRNRIGRPQPYLHRRSDADLSASTCRCCRKRRSACSASRIRRRCSPTRFTWKKASRRIAYIDIFDAGPVLTAQVDRSACVTRNETRVVREAAAAAQGATYLIAHNGADGEFRCVLGDLAEGKQAGAALPHAARAALGVEEGDAVRCVPLAPAASGRTIGRRTMIVVRVVQRGDVDALMRARAGNRPRPHHVQAGPRRARGPRRTRAPHDGRQGRAA